MNSIALSVKDVSKSFAVGIRPIEHLLDSFRLEPRKETKSIHALRDISFDIHNGEIVGIVGANGAGKSTLLRMIYGTLTPTSGTIQRNGKMAALLELGAGFNPELTGSENAMLYCLVQGFDKSAAIQTLARIEEFADIGVFFHQKIKTYSTGMFVRLAFAAAIQTDPDILIVDEALAVGDAKFVNKCFRRLEEFKASNKTLIVVSHDEHTILTHCQRVILLHGGSVFFDGSPKEGMSKYRQLLFGSNDSTLDDEKKATDAVAIAESQKLVSDLENFILSDGSEDLLPEHPFYNKYEKRRQIGKNAIYDVLLRSDAADKHKVKNIKSGSRVCLNFKVYAAQEVQEPIFGFELHSASGVQLFGTNNVILKKKVSSLAGNTTQAVGFEFDLPVREGDYFLSLGFANKSHDGDNILDFREAALHIKVEDGRTFDGMLNLNVSFFRQPT